MHIHDGCNIYLSIQDIDTVINVISRHCYCKRIQLTFFEMHLSTSLTFNVDETPLECELNGKGVGKLLPLFNLCLSLYKKYYPS